MNWEVEQKFRLPIDADVEEKLRELGVRFGLPVEQEDVYFNHPSRDFGITDEALRIRMVGDEVFVTYKGPKLDAETKTRQELELQVGSGVDVRSQFTALLQALGFQCVGTVKKQRRTASLQWGGCAVRVVLDEVEKVGRYLELEIVTNNEGREAAKIALIDLAKRLDLDVNERRSYLELLLLNKT